MPKIQTWLNKTDYKRFKERALLKGKTEYEYLKDIILAEIYSSQKKYDR